MHPAHAFALSLPEALEQDHHGIPSFRVHGRIFATVPDDDHLRIMVDEGEIRAAVSDDPGAFEAFWWGSRLAALVVDLRRAPPDHVRELLTEAWRRRAPKRLVRAFEAEGP
jgi:hypothetical protein